MSTLTVKGKIKDYSRRVDKTGNVQRGPLGIKKSYSTQGDNKAISIIKHTLQGKQVPSSLADHTVRDVRRLLVEHGLTLENVVERYKRILNEPSEVPKASDVLKVLERISSLHGINVNTDHMDRDETDLHGDAQKAMRDGTIQTYIIETTQKTQAIIQKLEERGIKPAEDVVEGAVVPTEGQAKG